MAFLFFASLTLAQGRDVGSIVGTVTDGEGNRLPGVTVTAKNVDTGLTQYAITNQSGQFRIGRLPRGAYDITTSLTGFKTHTKTGILLLSGAEIKINFTLEIGTIEEEITVIGIAPIVETTRAQVSSVITEKELLSYPTLNRNYFALMEYAPGTLPNAGRSGYAVNGQRGASNNMMLDGLDNNDIGTATDDTTTIPPEAIQEFRLVTNNFSAEYGRNTGGILNVVMKSGTNELHGSGWIFHRGDSALFQSEDWLTHDRPPYKRYQYGGTLGGPIIKDKTFFFATFEGISEKTEERTPYLFFTPEAISRAKGAAKTFFDNYGSAYPKPTYDFKDLDGDGLIDVGRYVWDGTDRVKANKGGLKLDHIFSEKDRIALRWLFNYYDEGWDFANVPGYEKRVPWHYHTGGLTWLHLFSPTMYNEVRIGFHRDYADWERVAPEVPLFNGGGYDYFGDGVHSVGDWSNMPQKFINNQLQIVDVLNFQKGDHNIKLGGELRFWRSHSIFDANVDGEYEYYYSSLDWLYDYGADGLWLGADPPDDPANPFGEWKRGVTERKWQGIEGGLFFQDDWRVSERLTVSGGLRWEYYGVPVEKSGIGINMPAFGTAAGGLTEGEYNEDGIRYLIVDGREKMGKKLWNEYWFAFAPKFSFAYDLTGDGKTSLRGGIARAFDRTFNNIYENDRFNFPDFCFAGFWSFPGAIIKPTIPATIPVENLGYVSYGLRWMLPDLKPTSAWNWLIGIQRELAQDAAIEINYSGSLGRNLGVVHRANRFTGDRLDGVPDGINPYFAIRNVNIRAQTEKSEYHALQVVLTKRFSNGWSWYSAYTFGKALDNNSDYFGDISGMEAVSHERLDMEWGRAAFDHTHRYVGGVVWDIPFLKDSTNWIVKNVIAGWQISSNFHITSGRPFNVSGTSTSTDWNYDYDYNDRPLWNGGDYSEIITWKEGKPYLDKSKFSVPNPPAYGGTSPNEWDTYDKSYYDQNFVERNAFSWFPTYNINIALQKYFTVPIGGRELNIQVIGEIFNLLNNTFWNLPRRTYQSIDFGETTRKSGVRRAQFSLRFMF